jgi:hypothetical protein
MKSDHQQPGRVQHGRSTEAERRPVWPLFFLLVGGLLTVTWIAFLGWVPLHWLDLL